MLSAESQAQGWIDRFAAILQLPERKGETFNSLHCRTGDRKDFHAVREQLSGDGANTANQTESLQTILISTSPTGDIDVAVDHCGSDDLAIINMSLLLYPVYRSVIRAGGVPFHAALAEHEGKAYLLAGVSGAGKSTCSSRLQGRWRSLCDDEVLLAPDAENRWRVHPMPTWSHYLSGGSGEKSWATAQGVLLAGIFFIEQSEVRDAADPMVNKAEVAAAMNSSSQQIWQKYSPYCNPELRKEMYGMIFDNVCRMAGHIPAWKLSVTLEGQFWIEMEKAIASRNSTLSSPLHARPSL